MAMVRFQNTNLKDKSKPSNSLSIVLKIGSFLLIALVITVSYREILPYKRRTYIASNKYATHISDIDTSIMTSQQCNITEYEANIIQLMVNIHESHIALQKLGPHVIRKKK
eukprot:152700_1